MSYCKCVCFADNVDLSFSLPIDDSKRSVQVSYTYMCSCKFVHVSIYVDIRIQVQMWV